MTVIKIRDNKGGPYLISQIHEGSYIPVSLRGPMTNHEWMGATEFECVENLRKTFGSSNVYSTDFANYKLALHFCLATFEDTFDIGTAIYVVKEAGLKVARKGWNGQDMFVYYVPENRYLPTTEIGESIVGLDGKVHYKEYLAIKTPTGVETWAPSIEDTLAKDWYIVTDY